MRSASAVDDLPYFLSLMAHLAERGVQLSAAGAESQAAKRLQRRWPGVPRRSSISSKASGRGGPTPRIAPASGEALAKMHLAGRDFPMFAQQPAVGVEAGVRCSIWPRRVPMSVQHGLRAFHRARARSSRKQRLAERFAARRHPRRSVSGQRVLPRRQAVRHDRLPVLLQRHACLRRRDLPQRLVLRDRIIPSTSPRRAHCSTPMAASGNCRTPSRMRCRCWRAARRCASC